MKKIIIFHTIFTLIFLLIFSTPIYAQKDTELDWVDWEPFEPRKEPIIIDHTCTNIWLNRTPDEIKILSHWIQKAKNLVIAYGHTSHGSQIVSGMKGLVGFMNEKDLYPANLFEHDGSGDALELRDRAMPGDLGGNWTRETRYYLNRHDDVDVIMWSWCGQADTSNAGRIATYLKDMDTLEKDFPKINFVYMTGHLNGRGRNDNLFDRNEEIRAFCRKYNKILFDFADIESYDPDGKTNYMELMANDNCDYANQAEEYTRPNNWAQNWQKNNPEDWYQCDSAHSQPLNANLKAYAVWWMFARISGWDGTFDSQTD